MANYSYQKVTKLRKNIHEGSTLIHIEQYSGDKQGLEKNNIPDTSELVTNTPLYTKMQKMRTKY